MSRTRFAFALLLPVLLAGCQADVLNPSGDVAAQQRDLLVQSTLLMLVIIIPVLALVGIFAWRYRQSNKAAPYEPDWDHSTHLELAIWGAPLLIITCLGALTWLGTHLLDPYRDVGRISAGQPVPAGTKPLVVDVVALDWKWLFIYPEQGVASVNELAAPVDQPIEFRITASSVMNSFYVPALAGQVYAMPGMETKLHAVINKPGDYRGISANYSGAGFSGMHFIFKGLDKSGFDAWIASLRSASSPLDRGVYQALEKPSENVPVQHYAGVDPKLYEAILEMCVEPGKMCSSQIAAIDAGGGLGLGNTTVQLADHRVAAASLGGDLRTMVAATCTPADGGFGETRLAIPVPADFSPLAGAGLPQPGRAPSVETVAVNAALPGPSRS